MGTNILLLHFSIKHESPNLGHHIGIFASLSASEVLEIGEATWNSFSFHESFSSLLDSICKMSVVLHLQISCQMFFI